MRTLSVGYTKREHKKVLLLGVTPAYQKIKASDLLMGLGKHEWESQQEVFWKKAITEAIQTGNNKADVTMMFSCDFSGEDEIGTYGKRQEDVIKFLMEKFFDEAVMTDDLLIVLMKPSVLKRFSV